MKFWVKVEVDVFEGRPSELLKRTAHKLREAWIILCRLALLASKKELANPSFDVPDSHNSALDRLLACSCAFESQNI